MSALGFVLSAGQRAWVVAAGLGALYLLLLPILVLASTGLRRHAREHVHLAHHDALTGVPNRMLFAHRLGELLASGDQVAVIVADVDRFKDINDRFGHLGGDELLRQMAERLSATVRATDTVARLGGDEFGILLPGAGTEIAEQVAGRIVAALPASASLGLACAPELGTDYDTVLQAADAAMYQAKQAGGGFLLANMPAEEPKAPGQAIGGLRPVRRAAPAKGG
jgi:diguanylate cyclase (GGDEF)-like protein